MPRISHYLIVFMVIALTACSNRSFEVNGQAQADDTLVKHWVEIKQHENNWNWVCYTELKDQVIQGFSCQNDTAMPLFSGGVVGDQFEYEYISKLILKITPERMLSYIKVALYQPGTFKNNKVAEKFIVDKNLNSTKITDLKKQLSITFTTL